MRRGARAPQCPAQVLGGCHWDGDVEGTSLPGGDLEFTCVESQMLGGHVRAGGREVRHPHSFIYMFIRSTYT